MHLVYLGAPLEALGFRLDRGLVLPDNLQLSADCITEAMERAKLVILTGGLGSTTDDLTREAMAMATDLPLTFSKEQEDVLRKKLRMRGSTGPLPESVRVQASAPRGATFLPNDRGSAPGIYLRHRGSILCALPGPREELVPIFEDYAIPKIKKDVPSRQASVRVKIRTFGLWEMQIQRMIHDIFTLSGPIRVGITAHPEGVDLTVRVLTQSQSRSKALAKKTVGQMKKMLGKAIYDIGDLSLEEVVARDLKKKKATVSVAESCTGGLLGELLTRISGSSKFFRGGMMVYSNDMKARLLGISKSLLKEKGAVSPEVASEMASNIRKIMGTDYGLGVTGIAGPSGGTKDKPVGLVHVALAMKKGPTLHKAHYMYGNRQIIRLRSAYAGLDMLRRAL